MNLNNNLNIDGNGTVPLRLSTGLLYGSATVSENSATPYLGMSPNFTVTFWVYLFRTDQTAYLISKVSHNVHNPYSITRQKVQRI